MRECGRRVNRTAADRRLVYGDEKGFVHSLAWMRQAALSLRVNR